MSNTTQVGSSRWIAGACALFALAAAAVQGQDVDPADTTRSGATVASGFDLPDQPFRRVASFSVFLNTNENLETVAEIVASARKGTLLVYTDSATKNIGFIDITDPSNPLPDGVVSVSGQPTSVAVRGNHVLACVNTSPNFVNTSGNLEVIDIDTRQIVRTIPLGGQPDAVALSPNGHFAVIAIENERDEDLGNGEPPQAPPGFVVIVDTVGPPAKWTTRKVDLVGIPDLFPDDPEPEFVDINAVNIAVVTMQENNHIALIRLSDGQVVADYPAGTVDLTEIDTLENDLIDQTSTLLGVPREPDAVAWTSNFTFATADEGDLFGGSRGFTTWRANGVPLFLAGNSVEHTVARLGHYPEDRSENKGNETEGVDFGRFGPQGFLFVGSERSNVVLVYELKGSPFLGNAHPVLRQVLPTGVGPEGLHAIPERGLLVVACETDDRDAKIRSTVMIYQRTGESTYPTIRSEDREGTDVPIPWGALSGLATDLESDATVYTVHDSFYRESRIYRVDRSFDPALITDELVLRDTNGVLLSELNALKAQLPGTNDFVPTEIVNPDGTVNLDLEAVAMDLDGVSFWVASEGGGNLVGGVSNPASQPFTSPNMLIQYLHVPGVLPFITPIDVIVRVVFLPIELTRDQFRFGFEGVAPTGLAVNGETLDLYVCFQRAWQVAGDPSGYARIGRYDLHSGGWSFAYYPLDTPTSPNGGWVGLSELTYLGQDRFAVIERDDQGGPDARIKRIYEFSIGGIQFAGHSQTPSLPVLQKTLVLDLLQADVYEPTGGPIPEKLEGMCVLSDGTTLIVNDNDGVDDNNGETQLLELIGLFD